MSARDELFELLAKHEDCAFSASGVLVCSCGAAMQPQEAQWEMANLAAHQSDVLLAAGWVKPRTITTVEELLALPSLTVVRSAAGSIVNIVGDEAFFFGYEVTAPVTTLALPATVLHEGQA